MVGERVSMPFPVHWSEGGPLSSMYGHYPSCYVSAQAFKNRYLARLYFSSFTGNHQKKGNGFLMFLLQFYFCLFLPAMWEALGAGSMKNNGQKVFLDFYSNF